MEDQSNTIANFDPFAVQTTTHTGKPAKRSRAPKSHNNDPLKVADRREKARERQRRKRERDRSIGLGVLVQPQQQNNPNSSMVSNTSVELNPEELVRRDRVRAAARERQRKHRALMKQRKMAELGLAMGNETMGGVEEAHYALQTDGQYQQVIPQPALHELGQETPALPQGHTGGQTFASTLLLSFSCSPLLKQHLLRTLHMSNEELASLEPVLSLAWDQWDHARRLHYAEQAAKAGVQEQNGPNEPHPYGVTSPAYDFRARFHRPLTAPSPFHALPDGLQQQASTSATSSEHPNEVIDPSLANAKEDVEGSGSDEGAKEQDRDEEEVAVNLDQE